MALSDLFSRRRKDDSDGAEPGAADSPVYPTKALAKFLSSLASHEQPLLVDLGPVVGTNVTFFGEELGCKIIVEDLYKDIDRHVREDKLDQLPSFFEHRFSKDEERVDGILCWDVFDYLDRAASDTLAKQLTRMLKPDGVLLAFFATSEPKPGTTPAYVRHVVVDRNNLQHRSYPAGRAKQRPVLNSNIQRMFEPLRITEQFLLKNNLREVLLRKPAVSAPASQ
jgi:hypothetical protein